MRNAVVFSSAVLAATFAGMAQAATVDRLEMLLRDAVQSAVAVEDATVNVLVKSKRMPSGCLAESAEVSRPITASGAMTLKVHGTAKKGGTCQGWANVEVDLLSPVMITTRIVRAGEPLDAATTVEWRSLGRGPTPASVKSGGIAARTLMAGQVVDAASVRSNRPSMGASVRVTIRKGALSVEQMGRLVACGNEQTCAVLPSGRRVEGTLEDDRLVVMLP